MMNYFRTHRPAKLKRRLDGAGAVRTSGSADIQTQLLRALEPFPQAVAAVRRALYGADQTLDRAA